METKSALSAGKSGTAVIRVAQRDNSPISLQKRRLQVVPLVNPATSTRVPILPENREYLKALRQAELRAWESATPDRRPSGASRSVRERLPGHEPNAGEGRLYVLLAVLCGLTLVSELGSLWHSAPGWRDFVEFVRHIVG
jgi:hypothetical protein